jgi:calcium/calmodulin-dependent protein kinase I
MADHGKEKDKKKKSEKTDKKKRGTEKAGGHRRKRRVDLISDPKAGTKAIRLLEGSQSNVKDFFEWTDASLLGTGAFAKVYRGVSKATKELVAIKVIDKSQVGKEVSPKSLQTEVEVLKTIDHPNIIKLKGVFEDNDNLYIITEIAMGGELFDRIINKGAYGERYAALLVKRILSAIDYLHDRQIVHRDLKPENLLLFAADNDLDIRVCDFGLARIVGNNTLIQTVVGSPNYVAPEVLQGMGYWKQADLWSIGVITYILLCGYPPFASPDIRDLLDLIQSGQYQYEEDYWEDITDLAKNFIDHLLVVNPDLRFTAKQALNHPWIRMCDAEASSPEKPLQVGNQMKETLEDWRGKVDVNRVEGGAASSADESDVYELLSAPYNSLIPIPPGGSVSLTVRKASPTVSLYRFLYNSVASEKNWPSRAALTDEQVSQILLNPSFMFGLLSVNGSPAGFVELETKAAETEILRVGVLPEFERREAFYVKLLLDFAVSASFSLPQCKRLYSNVDGG